MNRQGRSPSSKNVVGLGGALAGVGAAEAQLRERKARENVEVALVTLGERMNGRSSKAMAQARLAKLLRELADESVATYQALGSGLDTERLEVEKWLARRRPNPN